MKYTIDDLNNKYAEVGTPEADMFLKSCVELDIEWCDGSIGKPKCLENHIKDLGIFILNGVAYLKHVDILKRRGFTPFLLKSPKD